MKYDKKVTTSGKRKTSVAKATISEGEEKIIINGKPYQQLNFVRRMMIEEPVRITKQILGKFNYDVSVRVKGGGHESKIEAVRLAIAKAIVKISKSEKLRKAFLEYDRNLLIADVRKKEAYKPDDSKARAKRQSSKR